MAILDERPPEQSGALPAAAGRPMSTCSISAISQMWIEAEEALSVHEKSDATWASASVEECITPPRIPPASKRNHVKIAEMPKSSIGGENMQFRDYSPVNEW